ncbi:MAG: glycosyltransferase family 2 protein [Patescibacteria group bacterium]|nr:glycosyltransferase family 2 protein [Patescibacteria group bacterium]
MDLSIISVTWNSQEHIAEQIKSVRSGCQNISFEQFIVDNGSTDGTADLIARDFPEIKLIRNIDNAGFSAANNQAVKKATGEFLLFLNPDMRVAPGSLDKMVAWMRQRPNVGIVSCKLIDERGQVNLSALPRRLPGVWDQLAIILKLPHLFPGLLDKYLYQGFDADKEQEVDSVRGSFMLMRREVSDRLGWAFDPRYFIWFEDVDICRETRKFGLKIMYTPLISCVDYVGQSFKKRDTFWKQKQFTKSMLAYFQKWESWQRWIWIAVIRPVGLGLAWLSDFVSQKNKI